MRRDCGGVFVVGLGWIKGGLLGSTLLFERDVEECGGVWGGCLWRVG